MRAITGLSVSSEARRQRLMMIRIERRFVNRYKKEISRAMADAVKNFDNPNELSLVWSKHQANLKTILNDNWTVAASSFGKRVLDGAAKTVKASITEGRFFEAMRSIISTIGARRVTEIAGTTKEQSINLINQSLEEGLEVGASETEIAALMRSKINTLSTFRSSLIARTETSTAANTATHTAALKTGLPLKKEWATSVDGRERDTHKRANGQTQQVTEYFSVGGARLMHPSDPRGEAKEVINCRCVEVVGL